jgi:hypothetical protein
MALFVTLLKIEAGAHPPGSALHRQRGLNRGWEEDNAFPREAVAVVAVPGSAVSRLMEYVAAFAAAVKQELARAKTELQMTLTPATIPARAMPPDPD